MYNAHYISNSPHIRLLGSASDSFHRLFQLIDSGDHFLKLDSSFNKKNINISNNLNNNKLPQI